MTHTYYGIYDHDNHCLLVDEQAEGNNNEGNPMLFSSKGLAKECIDSMEAEEFCKPIPVKLSYKIPRINR
jgi:tetrahydromethanopterin S-methyltransferase subunit H